MTQEELLNTLGIKGERKVEADTITVKTNDSNLYSNWYSILDKSDLVDLIPDETVLNIDEAKLIYASDDYTITLSGDLENNVYELKIEEL